MIQNQRWVVPSALPSLGCVTTVKRYKSVHKKLSENKQNVFCVFFLQKLTCLNLKNDIPDFPDHLKSLFFHHRIQGCRLHMHEFFGLPKRLINDLSGSFYPKNSQFLRFSFKKWKKLGPPKRYSGLSRPPKVILISPSCSGMSTPYAWVFWALEMAY